MPSVHLNIHDSVYEQFLSFLGKFKNNEVTILDEKLPVEQLDEKFLIDKVDLNNIYTRYKAGKSKKYSQEEFESILDGK